ncbi:hypothetical protein ABIB94_007070 [Bradyrhizobium sp. JR7.2]|uniref:HNH endonuclease n=1 Tax=Bradyrhizobium sp. JR7.2 TaxID=3156375 RepID=UPI00339863E6
MTIPTQSQLVERLDYDLTTGIFTWRDTPRNRRRGKVAGHQTGKYVSIHWNNRHLQAHHVAWCYVTGRFPVGMLDHKDGNPHNNAFGNLREADTIQNCQNRRVSLTNSAGLKGVSFHKHSSCKNKWRAAITVNKKKIELGHFSTPEEGHAAYCAAEERYFGEFASICRSAA